VLIAGAERDDAAKQVQLKEQIAQPELSQFTVVFQPIVDLVTGHLRGVESLLRWEHPDLGPVPPDVFIPMAEHGGSIQVLGWHVLDLSCRQLARWRQESPEHRLAVGVNAATPAASSTSPGSRSGCSRSSSRTGSSRTRSCWS